MAAGRCAGCERTGSLRKINLHVIECPQFTALYAADPQRALAPAQEWLRHRREDTTEEARAVARGRRLTARFADINRQQAVSASRWATPPDILD